jgi:transposase
VDRESLKLLLAQGLSLEAIGRRYGKHPSTVGYWVQKHGLRAANADKHAPRGGITREALEALVASGASIAEIAGARGVGRTTVRHWLARYGLKTERSRGRHEGPPSERLHTTKRRCRRHGITDLRLEGRGYYRCLRCRADRVADRRRKVKQTLVAEAGGCCALCGYARYVGALQFHHVDPATKRFSLGMCGVTRSIEAARAEASKCLLLCSNCHAEVEAGLHGTVASAA